jgi:polyferredoxin
MNHNLEEAGFSIPFLSNASLHAICPFGGIETLYTYATSGELLSKLHDSVLVLAGIGVLLAILVGPAFCGWVCPLGSIQEWIGNIGKKIFKKKYNHFIPYKYDKYLRYTRYIVLAMIVYMSAKTVTLMFESMDPFYALFNFYTSEVAIGSMIILVITLLLSLFVERPWCKYACPYGAFLGVFNLFRIFKIKRNKSTCISCNICSNTCPMNIPVATKEVVLDHQCITCMKCTSENKCPIPNTVELRVK